MPFKKLGLIEPLVRATRTQGYTIPTAIQEEAIPHVIDGRDLIGCAQTGTGKTAAFALPILQLLHDQAVQADPTRNKRPIRSMVLTPTRELAAQIADSFNTYGRHSGLRHAVIFGGVNQRPQCDALRKGVDILVATPGRLLDLMNQGYVDLRSVEIFVLDEADRMLDMGFLPDVRRVIKQLPARRQTLLFSATMPPAIRQLTDTIQTKPVMVRIATKSVEADTVEQGIYFVKQTIKPQLIRQLLNEPEHTRTLVFCRTRRIVDRIAKKLKRADIHVEVIHSDKTQNARTRALESFKTGRVRVLVATDIAARGLDVEDISHVINYDLPDTAETYVHRVGRTGRATAFGKAISFCSPDQRDRLHDIEKLLGKSIPVYKVDFEALDALEPLEPKPKTPEKSSRPASRSNASEPNRSKRKPGPAKTPKRAQNTRNRDSSDRKQDADNQGGNRRPRPNSTGPKSFARPRRATRSGDGRSATA